MLTWMTQWKDQEIYTGKLHLDVCVFVCVCERVGV